jgi:hypothetical protein
VLVAIARWLVGFGRDGVLDALAIATCLGLALCRRFRRLFVFAACLLVALYVSRRLQFHLQSPRPYGVERLGRWEGFSNPSQPLAQLTVVVFGVVYGFVPDGLRRAIAGGLAIAFMTLVGSASVLLGVDYPSQAAVGIALPALIVVAAFRLACPDTVFPIRYGAGPPRTSSSTSAAAPRSRPPSATSSACRSSTWSPTGARRRAVRRQCG